MTVALSILFAALIGGVVFTLIDSSFERRQRAAQPAPTEPLPSWEPEPAPEPEPERRRDGLWAGWARD